MEMTGKSEWVNSYQLRELFGLGPANVDGAVESGEIRSAAVPRADGGEVRIYNADDVRSYLERLAEGGAR